MDLSKLPKLSDSPPPPPAAKDDDLPPAAPLAHPVADAPPPPAVQFADVWITIGIGVVLLFMYGRFLQWLLAKAGVGQFTWTFSQPDGTSIPYEKSDFFLGDVGVTAFAVVLILDGILAALRRPVMLLRVAIFLTVCTILINLYYVASIYSKMGPQFIPLLSFIFGVYIMTLQLSHLKASKSQRRPAAGIKTGA